MTQPEQEWAAEVFYGEAFEDKFSRDVFNLRGALSMANAGPNTNGSQFFVVTNQNVPAQMMSQLEDAGFPEEIIEATNGRNTLVRLPSYCFWSCC